MIILIDEKSKEKVRNLVPESCYRRIGQPEILCLAASDRQNRLASAAVAESRDGIVNLLWIQTAPSAQRQGLAGRLVRRMAGLLPSEGILTAEILTTPELQSAAKFLEKSGLWEEADGRSVCMTTVGRMFGDPFFRQPIPTKSVRSLRGVPAGYIEAFANSVERAGGMAAFPRPFRKMQYLQEDSLVYMRRNKIYGLILMKQYQRGGLLLAGAQTIHGAALSALLSELGQRIQTHYGAQTPFAVAAATGMTEALIHRFAAEYIRYGFRQFGCTKNTEGDIFPERMDTMVRMYNDMVTQESAREGAEPTARKEKRKKTENGQETEAPHSVALTQNKKAAQNEAVKQDGTEAEPSEKRKEAEREAR